jgi:hypothetical protein
MRYLNYQHSLAIFLRRLLVPMLLLAQCPPADAQQDVIRIMSYNVLKYGDGCQGPNGELHGYLKAITGYTKPDILGLVKVSAFPRTRGAAGKGPAGFADSILRFAVNSAFPDRYAYCPYTNKANENAQNILFYDKQKLSVASVVTLVSDGTDMNLYKLYYKSIDLPKTHDTSFLFIVLVHTDSGDKPDDRDRQLKKLAKAIRKQFSALPDMIVMGDFNFRKSKEAGYQALTDDAEPQYRFADPPFAPDKLIAYPANWSKNPENFAAFLTTSTRMKDNQPNECGTGGGAKSWYDHIFLSPSLTQKDNFYHYVPKTYHAVGNDRKRIGHSVNDLPNNSAPKEVLNALYHMSNKYPVMLELAASRK